MLTAEQNFQRLQTLHAEQVEANQDLGVIQYQSGEKQSERVFEVLDGYKSVPDGKGGWKRLGPGHRFHPTERQVDTNALRGKARELTGSELRGMAPSGKSVQGADVGLRALPFQKLALDLALRNGLREEDFQDVKPAGPGGRYTPEQVQAVIDGR